MARRFSSDSLELDLDGETYSFRPLKVKELEGLVAEYGEDEENAFALTAALIRTSSDDGKLEDVDAADLEEWPVRVFRKVQKAVMELNGMDADAGN